MSIGAGCLPVRCKTPFGCFREGEGPREEWMLFLLQKLHQLSYQHACFFHLNFKKTTEKHDFFFQNKLPLREKLCKSFHEEAALPQYWAICWLRDRSPSL